MKIRQGFVSNSSSSSFVVAIKKPSPKQIDGVKFIEILSKHGKNNSVWSNITSVSEMKRAIRMELLELETDLAFCESEIKFWKELSENRDFDIFLERFLEHSRNGDNKSARNIRQFLEQYKTMNSAKPCEMIVKRLGNMRDNTLLEILELKEYFLKISKLNASYTIYSFEEDMNFGSKIASGVIRDLVKMKQAIILKEIVS